MTSFSLMTLYPADVDTSRPDEKSVMTYVASYYHTFARMKNEQKSGKRIANVSHTFSSLTDPPSAQSVGALPPELQLAGSIPTQRKHLCDN